MTQWYTIWNYIGSERTILLRVTNWFLYSQKKYKTKKQSGYAELKVQMQFVFHWEKLYNQTTIKKKPTSM